MNRIGGTKRSKRPPVKRDAAISRLAGEIKGKYAQKHIHARGERALSVFGAFAPACIFGEIFARPPAFVDKMRARVYNV